MSVRRLAEENVQPPEFAFNAENAAWAEATIRKYPEGRQQSAVIPLLMRAQEQEGWVSRAAIEYVADMLGMAYIRVLEVATFYTQFQIKPVGTRAHVQVCGTTPCMLRGSEDLIRVCKKKIHHDPLTPNASGTLSWEEVECQGACVNAPMVIIFKDAYEDLTPERLEEIIDAFEAGNGADVPTGPQNGRHFSVPEGGPVTLLEEVVPVRTNLEAPAALSGEAAAAPTNAAKPVTASAEGDTSVKTPVTDKNGAAANAKAAETAAQKPSLDDPNRPKAVDRPEKPDDLELIAGIGPKIAATLNELGIFTYAQIAALTPAQIEWVDAYASFPGRIARDEWIKQADALARGGEEEYVRVFGKKPR
ncbi:NADH-quinone oxidoreductase subunit NuoE [Rhizobiaceae bacterium BDR2-2]|uniref:NADH-quinone oxidoreductase subunit NuoE n=1 Tax=Ectorhizobium quercum TaxID=2965071 RepID=A0AAE3N454_9HYPH|nr:NADH-quinone oxidoreductase subunit NuoE [Ectorhizobium quercum]MCX8998925.1 NADH-quinone oxidoreductase subunit NuoE [Ectorhizobium quercum]